MNKRYPKALSATAACYAANTSGTSARKLPARLDDLEAATNVKDLVAGNPHPLKNDRHGQFAVDLAGGRRLVFAPRHDPVPKNADLSIDWSRVTIITIQYIGNYHD